MYYKNFDDIIKIEDFEFDDVLIAEKSCKNVLIYDIWFMQESKLIPMIL